MTAPLAVKLGKRSYRIHFLSNAPEHCAQIIQKTFPATSIFIITNKRIYNLHGQSFDKAFKKHFTPLWITIPDGEKYKTLTTVEKILTSLSRQGASRKSGLIALGGGVVGDITGFAAALYMRGVPYIQIPTTLLAQVDSSVGGKTGVDLATGKNLAGAFHQPKAVCIDVKFLNTLPDREYRCGLAEVIKYGIIADADFFSYLKNNMYKILNRDSRVLLKIIRRCCAIKSHVVAHDEYDNGLRAILNYGHTLGHALETLTGFDRLRHGEAVAIGMCFAAKLAHRLGVCQAETASQITELLNVTGLPTAVPKFSAAKIITAMQKDKKNFDQNIQFVLPQKIGKVLMAPVKAKDIFSCL